MQKLSIILLAVVVGLIIGWFAGSGSDTNKIEESVSEIEIEPKAQPASPLIQELIQSSPNYVYHQEEYPTNREVLQYLGQVGTYKVVKYFAEFGPSGKAMKKVIFYSKDNTYIGFYTPVGDMGQVYPDGDSMVIDLQTISLAGPLPDSVEIGPEMYLKLHR